MQAAQQPFVPRPVAVQNGWNAIRDNTVVQVAIEAHIVEPDQTTAFVYTDGRRRLLHWRMILGTYTTGNQQKAGSVVDTWKQVLNNPVMTIVFSRRDFWLSRNARFAQQLTIIRSFTANDVKTLIEQHGYHRYAYDNRWSGCLYWIKSVVALLQDAGFIAQDSTQRLEQVVQMARDTRMMWVPDDRGIFF